MNFEWITLQWLMKNLNWIIGFLIFSTFILFLFPVLLGRDLKKKADKMKGQDDV
tara:strand:+ start:135 stop:296 length:162 start_codon:yes stop_codon:yes gene_type:complete